MQCQEKVVDKVLSKLLIEPLGFVSRSMCETQLVERNCPRIVIPGNLSQVGKRFNF